MAPLSDALSAAALATCLASALVLAVLQFTLDASTRERVGHGLALTALALLLFAARLMAGLAGFAWSDVTLAGLGILAALVFLIGVDRLLTRPEAA